MYKKYRKKDGSPSSPQKRKQGRSSRARGAVFERRIAKLYRKHGWLVQHNTKGIYDMVCIPPVSFQPETMPYPEMSENTPHLLQPTLEKYPPKVKKQSLIDNSHMWNGRAYLVQREPSYPYKLIFTPTDQLKVKH